MRPNVGGGEGLGEESNKSPVVSGGRLLPLTEDDWLVPSMGKDVQKNKPEHCYKSRGQKLNFCRHKSEMWRVLAM